MERTVKISISELKCLRRHVNQANAILEGLGFGTGAPSPARTKLKVTKAEKVRNYKRLLESGKKRTLPDHLKK